MSDYQETGKQIDKKYFIGLVRSQATVKAEVGELNGDLGERLKIAQDNSNLHLKAFRQICAMNRMEEQKRNAFWDALLLYHDFAQDELWGGSHVGDLDKMARAASDGDTHITVEMGDIKVEMTGSELHAMAESVKNAGGIGELEPEKHEENQKPKRRGRQPKAEKPADEDPVDAAAERGRIAWANREPGRIPDDLADRPAEAKAWLDAWERGQIEASKVRDAADFDAAEAKIREPALAGADAPGSYALHS